MAHPDSHKPTLRRLEDLPLYAEFDEPDWCSDLAGTAGRLFSDPNERFRRTTRNELLIYGNKDLLALGKHPDVSHQLYTRRASSIGTGGGTDWIEVLQDNNPFVLRAPQHQPWKRLGTRAVTTKSMSRYGRVAAAAIDEVLIDVSGRQVDVLRDITNPLLVRFWEAVLGIPRADSERLIEHVNDYMVAERPAPSPDQVRCMFAGANAYMELFTTRCREEMSRDMRPVLRELAADHAAMAPESRPAEPCAYLAAFALDAYHTLGTHISNGAYGLLAATDCYERVKSDQSLVPLAFLEGSRLYPGVLAQKRQATRDFDYHGMAIPKDTTLLMLWGFGNRDPAVFPAPDEYCLERPSRPRQVTFGTGTYICPGRNLGKLLGEILIARLTQPWVHVEVGDAPRWRSGTFHHDPVELPVVVRAKQRGEVSHN